MKYYLPQRVIDLAVEEANRMQLRRDAEVFLDHSNSIYLNVGALFVRYHTRQKDRFRNSVHELSMNPDSNWDMFYKENPKWFKNDNYYLLNDIII